MMTERQSQALDFIVKYQHEKGGVSPTVREIAIGIKVRGHGGIMRLLDGLEERGFIRRLPGRVRAIEVIPRRGNRIAMFKFDDNLKELVPWKKEAQN